MGGTPSSVQHGLLICLLSFWVKHSQPGPSLTLCFYGPPCPQDRTWKMTSIDAAVGHEVPRMKNSKDHPDLQPGSQVSNAQVSNAFAPQLSPFRLPE